MNVSSMTGFARASGRDETYNWTWEVKSVNSRSLDVRCRLPPGMDAFEPAARAALSERLHRGHVTVSLQVNHAAGGQPVKVNRAWLDDLIELARAYRDVKGIERPSLDGLLGLRGVIEPVEDVESDELRAEREAAMLATLKATLDELTESRRAEGGKLSALIGQQLSEIDALVSRAQASAAAQPDAAKARLESQVAELVEAGVPVPPERLAQELALLVTKADVREEIERLNTHREAAAKHLVAGGAIGRRLDFLAQELNREANTLCAKAADSELNEIGLELKAVIDQLREQAQNIE